jgi:hypothetical protein
MLGDIREPASRCKRMAQPVAAQVVVNIGIEAERRTVVVLSRFTNHSFLEYIQEGLVALPDFLLTDNHSD